MKKLPTAEKFKDESFYHGIGFYHYSGKDITQDVIKMMIEFAKLHVEEALKTVVKKAIEMNQWENEKISKNAIIKSYDLNNIK